MLTCSRLELGKINDMEMKINENQDAPHACTNIAHGMECSRSTPHVCTPLAGSSGREITNIVTREDHQRHELLQEADLMQNTESHFSIFHVLGSDANVCTMAQ